MKFPNTDYNYFVEIHIWRTKIDNIDLYRFSQGNQMPFWKDMDISEEDKINLEKNWKFYQKFYAFNSVYYPSLGRGYYPIYISNSANYPYESLHFHEFPEQKISPSLEVWKASKDTVIFTVALYAFPKMKLFYIGSMSEYSINMIRETFVWTKALDKTGEKKKYTFLPAEQNNNVLWYETYLPPYRNNIFYVFEKKMENPYWKLNSESIILPSDNPADSKTIQDVLKKVGKTPLKDYDVIVQTNSVPLYDIFHKDKPQYVLKTPEYTWEVFLFFLFILLSILFVQIMLEKKIDKM